MIVLTAIDKNSGKERIGCDVMGGAWLHRALVWCVQEHAKLVVLILRQKFFLKYVFVLLTLASRIVLAEVQSYNFNILSLYIQEIGLNR